MARVHFHPKHLKPPVNIKCKGQKVSTLSLFSIEMVITPKIFGRNTKQLLLKSKGFVALM